MLRKAKYGYCVECGEWRVLVVKAGYCGCCNETVRKGKSNKPSLKRTPIKPKNKNAKANNDFYRQAWEHWGKNGMLKCMESGKDLGEFSPSKVAHILSRKAFPALSYDFENVVPLLPEYHDQLDSGDCTKMKIWPWVKEKRQELKRKYYGAFS